MSGGPYDPMASQSAAERATAPLKTGTRRYSSWKHRRYNEQGRVRAGQPDSIHVSSQPCTPISDELSRIFAPLCSYDVVHFGFRVV